jgi:hypothetical protein
MDRDNSELLIFIHTIQRLLWQQQSANTVHFENFTKKGTKSSLFYVF